MALYAPASYTPSEPPPCKTNALCTPCTFLIYTIERLEAHYFFDLGTNVKMELGCHHGAISFFSN